MLQKIRRAWAWTFGNRRTLSKTAERIKQIPVIVYGIFCFDLLVHNFDFYYYIYDFVNYLDTALIFISFMHFTITTYRNFIWGEAIEYSDVNIMAIMTIIIICYLQYKYNYSEEYLIKYKMTMLCGALIMLMAKLTERK